MFGLSIRSEALISYVTALGFLIIAFISPLLSGIADYLGNKKFFLKLFCYVGAISCMSLYFFSIDDEMVVLSLVSYLLALIGFWGSLVFYNSYLPDIAHKEQQDKISAKGFSLGYAGSVALLLICLPMVMLVKDDQKLQMQVKVQVKQGQVYGAEGPACMLTINGIPTTTQFSGTIESFAN